MNLYIRAGTPGAAVPGSFSGPGSVGGAEYRTYGAGADKRDYLSDGEVGVLGILKVSRGLFTCIPGLFITCV